MPIFLHFFELQLHSVVTQFLFAFLQTQPRKQLPEQAQ